MKPVRQIGIFLFTDNPLATSNLHRGFVPDTQKNGTVKVYGNLFLFGVDGQNALRKIVPSKIKVSAFAFGVGTAASQN